jgi:hypothetical protein
MAQHAAAQTCVPPPAGLVSWYPADSYSADIQGANDGLIFGTTFAPGKVGQAFSVSSAGIVSIADSPDLSIRGSLTIDAWVNLRAYPTDAAFFAPLVTKWNDVNANDRGYALSALPDGRLRFDLSTNSLFGGSNSSTALSTIAVPLNTWTHIAAVFDSAARTQVLYINGVERGRVTGIPFGTIFDTVGYLSLGYGGIGSGSFKVANALIDETQIFNRALTATEVQTIYNAGGAGQCRPIAHTPPELVNYLPGDGNFYDYRRQTEYSGALNSSPFAIGKVDLAFNFNGTGPSYPIDVSGLSYKQSEVTIEAWVQTSATTNDYQAIVSATDQSFVHLQLLDNGGNNIGVFTDTGLVLLPTIPQTPTGVWRHIALSVKSGETKLFLNGALFGSNPATFSRILYANDIRVGGGYANGRFFKGQIDEVSIYTRALSQTEIQDVYNAGSAGKLEPSNDDFNRGKFLSAAPGSQLLDFVRASKEQGEPNHAGVIGGSSVWYRWIAPATGQAYFDTGDPDERFGNILHQAVGSNYDTLLAIYTGTSLNALTRVASNDDRPTPPIPPGGELPPTVDLTSKVAFNAVAGQEYRIAVDGVHGQAGRLRLQWGQTISISGSVSHRASGCLTSSGCPVPGVTVTLSGSVTGSAVTNSSGQYSFTALPVGGNYTVGAAGYGGRSVSAFANATVNLCDNCPAITDSTITIRGAAGGSGGLAYPGVTMFLNSLSGPSAVTGVDGSFIFPNLAVGHTYTIIPVSRTADNPLTFSPPSLTFNNAESDVLSANFQVTGGQLQYFVSGFVKDAGGLPIAGVTMTLSGTQAAVTQTDAGGAYSFDLAPGGNYSISAAKAGLGFTEGTLTYASLSQSFKTANFTAVPDTVQLSAASYNLSEGDGRAIVTLTRPPNTQGFAVVDYKTVDNSAAAPCDPTARQSNGSLYPQGIASSRCDYETSIGSIKFAAGETSKTVSIFIVDDAYLEGTENLTVTLSNPSGATLGGQASATVAITDNEIANGVNSIDTAGFFVRLHYLDFLNREPDTSGLNFWTGEITQCGTNAPCIENKRVNVSAAFYLSIEFQQTGYLVERLYKAAYGNASGASTFGGAHQLPVPVVRLNEFLPDTQQIGQGVIVGQTGWEQVLENNKQTFTAVFVQRSRFTTAYPNSLTAAQFVDALNANAGNPLSQAERDQLVNDLATSAKTRAQVLRAVAEDADLVTAETNRAFVLMQFFGYLRRNPNDPQDTDYTGYDFWLTKLNQFNGNFQQAEMVKAFITSIEYRQRFGQP